MTSSLRSAAGAMTAMLAIPLILGIVACLPVPIGDPARSRIDAELSGIWLMWGEDTSVTLFEPWDKRTWLVTMYEFDADDCVPPGDQESESGWPDEPDYAAAIAAIRGSAPDCLERQEQYSFKAWVKPLAGAQFMTWEPIGYYDAEHGFEPEFWYGFLVDKVAADEFRLWMIDLDYDGFDELDENEKFRTMKRDPRPREPGDLRSARRAFERVLRRHADDRDMVVDDPMIFARLEPEDYDLFVGDIVPAFE